MGKARLVIAGTQSGVGKTTIAIGLMAALSRQGYNVQPYKVGPDYIDPGFHTLVTKNRSRNLDSYFLGKEGVKEFFLDSSKKADISIIEGVMGLFDGKGKDSESSTAQIAGILKSPVILIIDGKKIAQSAAAIAYGYKNLVPELKVAGVIINNIASRGHYQMIKESIVSQVGLKVLGYLPIEKDLKLPERYLGLVPTTESKDLKKYIAKLASLIEDYIDLEQLITLAQDVSDLDKTHNLINPTIKEKSIFPRIRDYGVKVGIAYDQAFNFYYRYNLDLLEMMGAELIYFSPLKDEKLPDIDGLYLGGGFPESFLLELAANRKMKESLYKAIKTGLPTYAECGGLMYLTREIKDFAKNSFAMVGVIPAQIEMKNKLQAMGYVRVKAVKDNILFKKGEEAKGHEFHYSCLVDFLNKSYCYQLYGGKGKDGRPAGYVTKNLLATYVHLHFASNPYLAKRFLKNCQDFNQEKLDLSRKI